MSPRSKYIYIYTVYEADDSMRCGLQWLYDNRRLGCILICLYFLFTNMCDARKIGWIFFGDGGVLLTNMESGLFAGGR